MNGESAIDIEVLERARKLLEKNGLVVPANSRAARRRLATALASVLEIDGATADQIGFHLTDWMESALFLVAIASEPSHFTDQEVCSGVLLLVGDVPAHVDTAAQLCGFGEEE